jgi:transcriptional regulator
MYTPPAFKENDLVAMHDTMRAARLANLVTATAEGLMVTPLPLMLDATEGPYGVLHGHLARANPQWRTQVIGEACVIFMGPDAYVSPSWYATKQETHRVVPTWNYIAVHAYGPAEFYDDADRLHDVVARLTERHEHARAKPWAVSDAPAPFIGAQLKGIVGLRVPVKRLEGKRKMSQNRNAADRAGVAAGLAESEDAADRVVASLIPL